MVKSQSKLQSTLTVFLQKPCKNVWLFAIKPIASQKNSAMMQGLKKFVIITHYFKPIISQG
ncbi:MAG TPA: hypothetical protein DIS69_09220 [Moraxellaceae bacterium]|nr:hypothetical protein [Moraxellaceae bacterium]